jgi:hypothetical protein
MHQKGNKRLEAVQSKCEGRVINALPFLFSAKPDFSLSSTLPFSSQEVRKHFYPS